MKDYYALLSVARTASPDEIKRAFRKLAVKYHPDKNSDPRAAEFFKELTEAYNVLSDWEKRKFYDLRFENPFQPSVAKPAVRKHRDPRYAPKPPGYRARPKYSVKDLMTDCLPYFRVISYTGLVFGLLLSLDFFLPYNANMEKVITSENRINGKKGNYIFVTESGKEIRVYNEGARFLIEEELLRVHQTQIFNTIMKISDKGPTFELTTGYLYRTLILVPLILLVSSVLGVVYRKNLEFRFNLSLVSGIFLILTIILMVML
jgi:curved DNA-binding protein CbpA